MGAGTGGAGSSGSSLTNKDFQPPPFFFSSATLAPDVGFGTVLYTKELGLARVMWRTIELLDLTPQKSFETPGFPKEMVNHLVTLKVVAAAFVAALTRSNLILAILGALSFST